MPDHFSLFVGQKWDMEFDDRPVCLTVSYLDHDLNDKQREDFRNFITNQEPAFMHKWLISVIPKLFTKTLNKEWVNEQDFAKNLKSHCGLKMILIMNFPCETVLIPRDEYPLAFVLSAV